jgi:hypothetical protein
VGLRPPGSRRCSSFCSSVRLGLVLLGAYPKMNSPLAWGPTPPFYRPRGRPAVASLGRSHKERVKPNVLPGVKPRVLMGPRVAWLSRIYCGKRHGTAWVQGAIIHAMPTYVHRRLWLSTARRVAPCQLSAHSGLVR